MSKEVLILKVSLEDFEKPVWRRVAVYSDISFGELSYILLGAFEYSGKSPHCVRFPRVNKLPFLPNAIIKHKEYIAQHSEEEAMIFGYRLKDEITITLFPLSLTDIPAQNIELSDLIYRPKQSFKWCYSELGDITAKVVVEKILSQEGFNQEYSKTGKEVEVPSCLKGKNSPKRQWEKQLDKEENMEQIMKIACIKLMPKILRKNYEYTDIFTQATEGLDIENINKLIKNRAKYKILSEEILGMDITFLEEE